MSTDGTLKQTIMLQMVLVAYESTANAGNESLVQINTNAITI